jgi:hypothetical protein
MKIESDMNQFNQAISDRQVAFWEKERKNFTSEADAIMEKVKKGEELDELESFILICDNEAQIEEYKKIHLLNKKVSDEVFSSADLKTTCDMVFGENSTEGLMVYNGMIVKEKVQVDDDTYSSSLRDFIISTYGENNPNNQQIYDEIMNNRLKGKDDIGQNVK